MQLPADGRVDPDGPATEAALTPTAGGSPGWTPPPWSPDAADTRPFWRRIPAGWLITGALVLLGRFRRWVFQLEPIGDRRARGRACQADSGPQRASARFQAARRPARRGLFDLNDPTADQIEDVKAVPCTTEHEFEVFYVGAMREGSYPTDAAAEQEKSRTRSHRHRGRVLDVPGPQLHPRVPYLYR